MKGRFGFLVLIVVMAVAAGIAALAPKKAPANVTVPAESAEVAAAAPQLPPNHPNIHSPNHGVVPTSEGPAIRWSVPPEWETAPSPNSMRLATYRAPGAGGPAEVSVVRAGGSNEANIQRWLDDFDDMGKETRTPLTVVDMPVTVVETSGTYVGGSMGQERVRHDHWRLLAAIVETAGSHYFFKMLGPADTVMAARPAFDRLLRSIAPLKS